MQLEENLKNWKGFSQNPNKKGGSETRIVHID